MTIKGRKHWLWRAIDRHGAMLDVLVQNRRNKAAARRLMRKLFTRMGAARNYGVQAAQLCTGECLTGPER